MSEPEKEVAKGKADRVPRLVCAFSALFAIAVPAFAVIVGVRLQPVLAEMIVRCGRIGGGEGGAVTAAKILDACEPASWLLLVVGVAAAVVLFALMRKNSTAGTLDGAGTIAILLTLSGALSAFYLAAMLFAVALSV